ncbi:hypothetical protein GGR53DRAFT_99628 [Hypoxylon sp. FL1150]|nr:hypothetical protein GGR53DRAFT_99628 [Hypoxylon sp. FL1150]
MASTTEDGQKEDSHMNERFGESDLREALESIACKGDFAALQAIPRGRCDPDIFVQDVGRVDLPLSEAQAKQLIAKSHQAPFGKGSDTIVDTSVRNTWELDPSRFEIRGASWQSQLDAMLCRVRDQLGITAPITAELYKMLVYEKGAMFKAHTDTEKTPGMFGTLVVSLPSPHEGGDVVVKHCGMEKILQTSEEEMACLFWYSDVSHEVLPVTSGYRWVLTYNLAIDPAAELPTADSIPENARLRKTLQLWMQEVENASLIPWPRYWVLDHKYTEANISYQGLKTVDRERVRYLRKMCSELNFDLFLATLEKEEIGPCEEHGYIDDNGFHELEFVVDTSYRSKHVTDLSGNLLATNLALHASNILQKDSFDDIPDKEDYEGFMGNSGPEATHWYRLSALVIVPWYGTVSLLAPDPFTYERAFHFSGTTHVQELCNFFVAQLRNCPKEVRAVVQLRALLRVNYTNPFFHSKTKLTGDCLIKVLQVCIRGTEPRLLDLMLSGNKNRPPIEFFTWIKEDYDNSVISIEDFEKLFTYAIDLEPTICRDFEAISAVNGDAETTSEIQDIIHHTIDDCTKSYREWDLEEAEGPALFNLSIYHRDFNHLKEVVVPIVEEHSFRTAFAFGFLQTLYQSIKCGQIPRDEAQPLYERVARKVVQNIDLTSLTTIDTSCQKTTTYPSQYAFQYPPPRPELEQPQNTNSITYKSMLKFISTLVALNLKEDLKLFAEKVSRQANRIKGQEFHQLWIPFLQGLFLTFKLRKMTPSAPHWTQIYQSLLEAYVLNYVREEPPKPSLPPACTFSCKDCFAVNVFLADPDESVGYFNMSEERRRHVQARILGARADCETTTEVTYRSPHTLVVRKTTKRHGAGGRDAWLERRLQAGRQLGAFDQAMLRTVLAGQKKLDDIVSMKMLGREEPRTSLPSTSSHRYGGPPAGAEGLPATRVAVASSSLTSHLPNPAAAAAAAGPARTWPSAPNHPSVPYRTPVRASQPIPTPARSWTSVPNYPSIPDRTPVRAAPASYHTPQERPAKRPMLEVSRRISESANRVRASKDLEKRSASTSMSSPSSRRNGVHSTPSRPTVSHTTTTIANPTPGAKRKHIEIEVIDLTGDD